MEFKPVDELEFTDDYMFGTVMRNKEICKGVLERLLKIEIEDIEYPELQKEIRPYYQSHGIRMDVYVKETGRVFDIEMQTSVPDALEKRMRYYQSMVDMDSLVKGREYDELKESYIIFICRKDVFGKGLPVYRFETVCMENEGIEFNDSAHKIVYNSSSFEYEKDEDLHSFLKFIETNRPSDAFTERLSDSVKNARENELFRSTYLSMNLHDYDLTKKAKAEGRQEGITEGVLKGKAEGKLEIIRDLYRDEIMSAEEILEKYGITEKQLEE